MADAPGLDSATWLRPKPVAASLTRRAVADGGHGAVAAGAHAEGEPLLARDGSSSPGLTDEERGTAGAAAPQDHHNHSAQGPSPPSDKLLYLAGEIVMDDSRLPLVRPLAVLAAYILVTSYASRLADRTISTTLRLTDLEVVLVSSLLSNVGWGVEAILTRPALAVRPLPWCDYAKVRTRQLRAMFASCARTLTGARSLHATPRTHGTAAFGVAPASAPAPLHAPGHAFAPVRVCVRALRQLLPWSASAALFFVLGDVVTSSLSNGYLARSYGSLAAVGFVAACVLFGQRFPRGTKLFFAAVAVIAVNVAVTVGRRFPSQYVAVHVIMWGLVFALYCKLTPAVPVPSPEVAPATDTFGFVAAVSAGALSLAALLLLLPTFFPVDLWAALTHIVYGCPPLPPPCAPPPLRPHASPRVHGQAPVLVRRVVVGAVAAAVHLAAVSVRVHA